MGAAQIRLHEGTRLGDLAKDIIAGFETVLRYNKQPVQWGHRQKTKLIRLIRARLARAVQGYQPCGEQSRCHAASKPIADAQAWRLSPPNGSQHILLLKIPVAALCLQLESTVFERYYPGAKDAVWLPLKPEFDQAIEDALQPVLYENPYCEACPLCTSATRISPWTLKPSRSKKRAKAL
jgi:hypothetical protein